MSEQQTEVTTLGQLPSRINEHHRLAQEHAASAVAHARQAGDLLLEAKRTIGHGGWLAWLAANVTFSERTAQGYMRLASLAPAKAQRVADLSLREALAAIAGPSPEGEQDLITKARQFELEGERLEREALGLKVQAERLQEMSCAEVAGLRLAAEDLALRAGEHRFRAERHLGEVLRGMSEPFRTLLPGLNEQQLDGFIICAGQRVAALRKEATP